MVKALDDIEDRTRDAEAVGCITAALTFRNGVSLCNVFGTTLAILDFSSRCTKLNTKEVYKLAEDSVQEFSPTFNAKRDCSSFFSHHFDLDDHTDDVIDSIRRRS